MKFDLTTQEIALLKEKGITAEKHYTEEEALELLDQVRDIEISYAQFTGGAEKSLYFQYGDLADKIQAQIPEE